MRKYIPVFFLMTSFFNGMAQQSDTTKVRQNTIKLNLISSFLYSNSAAMSYERVTKRPNQSWGIMLGYVQFPKLGSLGPSIGAGSDFNNTGYVVGGEYRFYLKKENKYTAPHGVYIGPYTNYFYFNNERQLSFTASDGTVTQANLKTELTALNIGVQLGYQFVLNDRWAFDVIFIGPSLSHYGLNAQLSGDLSQENILGNELIAALADRFPLIKDLLSGEPVNLHGSNSKWGTGFRYQLNVGYRFGKKK